MGLAAWEAPHLDCSMPWLHASLWHDLCNNLGVAFGRDIRHPKVGEGGLTNAQRKSHDLSHVYQLVGKHKSCLALLVTDTRKLNIKSNLNPSIFMPEILPTPADRVPSEYFTRGCTGTGPPSPAINSTNSYQLPWAQHDEVLKIGITSQNHVEKSYHNQTQASQQLNKPNSVWKGKIFFSGMYYKKNQGCGINYFKKIVGSRFPRHFDGGLSSTMTCHDPQGAGKIWHLFVIQRQTTQLFLVRPCNFSVHDCKPFGRWRIGPSIGKGKIWAIYLNKLNKIINMVHDDSFMVWMWTKLPRLAHRRSSVISSVFHQKSGELQWSGDLRSSCPESCWTTWACVFHHLLQKGHREGCGQLICLQRGQRETMVAQRNICVFSLTSNNYLTNSTPSMMHLWGGGDRDFGMYWCFQKDFKHTQKPVKNADCSAYL